MYSLGLCNRQALMQELHTALLRKVCSCVAISSQNPLGGQKPFQAYGSTSMDTSSADTNLCTYKRQKGHLHQECTAVMCCFETFPPFVKSDKNVSFESFCMFGLVSNDLDLVFIYCMSTD